MNNDLNTGPGFAEFCRALYSGNGYRIPENDLELNDGQDHIFKANEQKELDRIRIYARKKHKVILRYNKVRFPRAANDGKGAKE